VAVVKDGRVLVSKGFGLRELGRTEPVDQQTLFAIASNTKAFTAAAICMLEDDGRLRRDDRVHQHLPWLQLSEQWASADLRIDDLLCHRSGLATFSGDLLWWGTPYTPEDVLRRMRHLPIQNRFRAEYGYSNLMFLAAGEVIRSVTGNSWPVFIRSRISATSEYAARTALSTTELVQLGNAATPPQNIRHGRHPDSLGELGYDGGCRWRDFLLRRHGKMAAAAIAAWRAGDGWTAVFKGGFASHVDTTHCDPRE
jgi:CubicO group peptidase (beta-lactamase class C family)